MPERLHGRTLAEQGLALPETKAMVTRDPGDASVGTGNFTQGVPAFWFARSLEYGSAETLYNPYSDSVWVQRCIKKVSQPIASINMEFTQARPRLGTAAIRRRAPGDKPAKLNDDFLEFLAEPVAGLGWEDFVEASIGWLKMAECFWLLDDSVNVPFPEERKTFPKIIIARPDRMRPVIEQGYLAGWSYTPPTGRAVALLPGQVIRLINWNPYNDWRGLGEYKSAHIAAESDWLAGKFGRNLMANNGDLGGIIIAKSGVPTDDQRQQIIMDLRAKREAQLRGQLKYTFLTGDIDVKDAKVTSVDAPFIQQRLENRHEIAFAFGLPMSMVDIKAAYSMGSSSDYYQLINDTCVPTSNKFCTAVERVIYLFTGQRVTVIPNWDEHPVMQAVRRERLDSADKLWNKGMPMRKISDYLALDLPRFDGDDTGFIPISLSPITNADGEVDRGPSDADYSEQAPAAPTGEKDDGTPAPVKEMLRILRQPAQSTFTRAASSENEVLWKNHMRMRSKAVRMYQSKASKIILEYRIKALKKLQTIASGQKSGDPIVTRSILDLIFDPKDFGMSLANGLSPVTQSVLQTAGTELLAEIGRADDPWKFPPKAALEFIASRENLIAGCGDTVHAKLKTALDEAARAGESMDKITDRVRGIFNDVSKFEARRIAMTETGATYGFSRDKAMKEAGVEYKTWLTSHGPNVREAHQMAEEKYGANPIPVDEPFIVDGEELMYPCDSSGSSGNVINCQCVQLASQPPENKEDQ